MPGQKTGSYNSVGAARGARGCELVYAECVRPRLVEIDLQLLSGRCKPRGEVSGLAMMTNVSDWLNGVRNHGEATAGKQESDASPRNGIRLRYWD